MPFLGLAFAAGFLSAVADVSGSWAKDMQDQDRAEREEEIWRRRYGRESPVRRGGR